jgi:hypothetical protein
MSYGGTPAGLQLRRPRAVTIGAGLLAAVGVLGVVRVAYGVLVNLGQRDWDPGARVVFLVLNSFVLIFALFVIMLADQVRRGRRWAWVVSLVVLPFSTLFGGVLLLIAVVDGEVPWSGAVMVPASVATLLTLTVPRTARGSFVRRQIPAAPAPWPAVHQWGPGHPPA